MARQGCWATAFVPETDAGLVSAERLRPTAARTQKTAASDVLAKRPSRSSSSPDTAKA
jgi:hypothetical protein